MLRTCVIASIRGIGRPEKRVDSPGLENGSVASSRIGVGEEFVGIEEGGIANSRPAI